MHNPLKSVVNTFFPQAQSEELLAAKVEIEKWILHHPVSIFVGTHDGNRDETALEILKKDFNEKWIGVYDIDHVPSPEDFHRAVTIRAYDRNTQMGPFIQLPQIYVEGTHIGTVHELEKRQKDEDWPEIVARVNKGPSPDDPRYWMAQGRQAEASGAQATL